MPALYTIIREITDILDLETDEGELSPCTEERLESLGLDLTDKVDNVLRFVRTLEAEADGYAKEATRLKRMAELNSAKADRLKQYVKACLEEGGMTRLKTELFGVTIQANSRPSIRLVEGAEVPANFSRVVVSLDGNAAYEAWREGKALPPALVVERGTHLRIR